MTLTLRTWAIRGKSKQLAFILFGTLTVVWVSIAILGGFYLKLSTSELPYQLSQTSAKAANTTTDMTSPAPALVGCIVTGANQYLLACYVLVAVYDTGQ